MSFRSLAAPAGLPLVVVLLTLLLGRNVSAAEASSGASARPAPAPAGSAAPAAPRIDLNLATQVELESLPKIGPATAKRILEYRKQVGTIKTVDELVNVQGIGEKTLELLRPHVTVGNSVPAPSAPRKS